MRIEPVFLVAPRTPASDVSRRSFLLAGATFACGVSFGGACVFASGGARLPDDALAPTGDAELDQLRRLAIDGSDAQLVQHRLLLVSWTFSHYCHDAALWRGIGRLCDLVIADAAFPDRSRFARALAGVIERAEVPVAAPLQQRAQALRSVR